MIVRLRLTAPDGFRLMKGKPKTVIAIVRVDKGEIVTLPMLVRGTTACSRGWRNHPSALFEPDGSPSRQALSSPALWPNGPIDGTDTSEVAALLSLAHIFNPFCSVKIFPMIVRTTTASLVQSDADSRHRDQSGRFP
jgi:hypothetical protein